MRSLFGARNLGPVMSTALACTILLVLGQPGGAVAASPPSTEGWTQVVEGGFADPGNSHVAFSAEFDGYLYVSTMASEAGGLYAGSDKLGGDIWRTSDGTDWEQVGTAGLGNPRNTMFDLVVFKDELYALSYNLNDHGLEIWVTSDGREFARVEAGRFGDPSNDHATPLVFNGRLILGVGNSKTGVQIWVSDDGRSFRRVVSGGLGQSGTTGMLRPIDPVDPLMLFRDQLYVGVSNPASGGEIWRTADGLRWERVADKGLGRASSISLAPDLVYRDRLYAFGYGGGTLDEIAGFELFRSSDGTDWERVVEDGFGVGPERNVQGELVEFNDKLYLTSSTMDPRILVPGKPIERLAPKGFQLRVSDDGSTWTTVGADGFGRDSSLIAGTNVIGDALYLEAYDYHAGSQLWTSTDGQDWRMIFQEPEPSFFSQGGGVREYEGHLLWFDNDLANGAEIWRSDDVRVADATATTATPAEGGGTTPAGSDDTTTTIAAGGGSSGGDGSQPAGPEDGAAGSAGLPGWALALIIALASAAVVAGGVAVYLVGKARGAGGTASGSASAIAGPASSPGSCSQCASAIDSGSAYCPGCGRKLQNRLST